MAELNLKQITDKLNQEFQGETRRLVFWYDDQGEFSEDLDQLELENAQILKLEKDNQFFTKHFLERVDLETNYLIYAPFPRPKVRDNHLEDTLLYSKQFFADRASLLVLDLRIDPKYKGLIQKHIKFFRAKERTQRLYELELDSYTKETIEVALMSVLCRTNIPTFDEVLRVVLTADELVDNKFLAEFAKYDLLEAFWRLCEEQFGYGENEPGLEKLLLTLFTTHAERFIQAELPKAWQNFISHKAGNNIAFLNQLMNNVLYRGKYDELSEYVAQSLQVKKTLTDYAPESLLACETFAAVDQILIDWIKNRLLDEDLGAKLSDLSLPALCQGRRKAHFAERYRNEYHLLESAYHVISAVNYPAKTKAGEIFASYLKTDYWIDQQYRKFYFNYDRLSENSPFEDLRDLVENIYTNKFLNVSATTWNQAFSKEGAFSGPTLQRQFFRSHVEPSKDRTVVIISDALRYEVAEALFQKLEADEKCTPRLKAMLGVLPSFTKLGMAALLPHQKLEMTADYKVLVDGLPSDSLKQREAILKAHRANSACIQFDDLKHMKRAELREIFTEMDVVYVYHNQIDARGDKLVTENEVFTACSEAIEELFGFIKRISSNANTSHFIITADHGFIYKRDKLDETDKISQIAEKDALINRRFIVSQEKLTGDGIVDYDLGTILGNDDQRTVSLPLSTHVFKVPGGGQNYVHGGSSLQELIIPVIDVKVEKGHTETRPAQIMLVSMINKITNLISSLDLIQSEPVSDIVKETNYRLVFMSESGEKISNECRYIADRKDLDPNKRIFRLRFNFKNMQYDRTKPYYLVAYDESNDLEVLRHAVVMDLAFADDFGF